MKPQTYGFGVDPTQNPNHFFVQIDHNISNTVFAAPVQVYERYSWSDNDEQAIEPSDKLRLQTSKWKWIKVKDILTAEFNARLKKDGLRVGKFSAAGGTPVERLLGKEMMVLLWSIEDCDISVIPTAIRNWKGLMPEERWWLYTMTNAASGELRERKGWRTALRYALCENPIAEFQQIIAL